MSSVSLIPVSAFSCTTSTVLCVACVEQERERMLFFCRSDDVEQFIQCTQSVCLCVNVITECLDGFL